MHTDPDVSFPFRSRSELGWAEQQRDDARADLFATAYKLSLARQELREWKARFYLLLFAFVLVALVVAGSAPFRSN